MLAVAVAFAGCAWAFAPGRALGAVFLLALLGYIAFALWQERTASAGGAVQAKGDALVAADPLLDLPATPKGPILKAIALALAGLVLVVLGGKALVGGAVDIARAFGIPETVIGLTIVAVGTSMPELVTSVVAGLKRQTEVALGNIIGSNIYNILGIGGATAIAAPGPVPETIAGFDAPLMVAVSLLLVVMAATGLRISRREGALLLAGYAAYLWMLWP